MIRSCVMLNVLTMTAARLGVSDPSLVQNRRGHRFPILPLRRCLAERLECRTGGSSFHFGAVEVGKGSAGVGDQ